MNKKKIIALMSISAVVLSQAASVVSAVSATEQDQVLETLMTETTVSSVPDVVLTEALLVTEPTVPLLVTESEVFSEVILPESETTTSQTSTSQTSTEVSSSSTESTVTSPVTDSSNADTTQPSQPVVSEVPVPVVTENQLTSETTTTVSTVSSSTTTVSEKKSEESSEDAGLSTAVTEPYIADVLYGGDYLLDNTPSDSVINGSAYVEHWTGKDAYTHNILSHRYGIKAEQLDGFLDSTGIKYDKSRINGKKLLEWEKASGLDVRAIVAIAIAESSLGTAGVATEPGANMFGYGAFDNNPSNATNYNDEVAVKQLTKVSIIKHKNTSFKRQDEKAAKHAKGQLTAADGGVYFTDTTGSGKRRAEIMEKLDKWIDEHGGTPEIPEHLKINSKVSLTEVPDGYEISKPINTSAYVAVTYPWGQCTWYVYNRGNQLGQQFDPFMGNGGDWQNKAGYQTTHTPEVGYAVSFTPGQAGADLTYGHVAIVEEVKEDGSILISEANAMGLGTVSYRTFTAAEASQLTYVEGR